MNKVFKLLPLLIVLLLPGLPLFSLQGELVYVEGTVDLKLAGGGLEYADIGMPVETGDTVITGYDGYAELELEDGSTVRVNEDSIFKIAGIKTDEGTKNNFQLVLGSAAYKFTSTMKEQEPTISTPSTVCGLRGTSFTVVAGLDGSALYAVEEGSVAVSSQGGEVQLGAEEGVRVLSGQTPGEPFKMLKGKVDYSAFLMEAETAFFEDPAGTVYPMIETLKGYIADAEGYEAIYQKAKADLDPLYEDRNKLEGDAKKKYYQETVYPVELLASKSKYNVRFFALSGLSLRRYVLGNMYVQMKTQYIKNQSNPVYRDFMMAYHEFLDLYEKGIVPYLVAQDIK